MIYITQLIYLKRGQEDIFNEFESQAIPLISKYDGNLIVRIRPTSETVIESTIEKPYEIHIISFKDDTSLKAYMADEERKRYINMKEQSIRESFLIKGEKL